MEKRFLQFLLLAGLALLIFFTWRPFWRMDLNEAVSPKSDEKVIFEIEKGSSGTKIAKELKKSELIVSSRSFIRTIESEELDQELRFGRFVLSPSMTLREVVTVLTTAGSGEMAITVIEGWTINQIDAKLTEMELIESGEFRLCTFNCKFEYEFLGNDPSLEGFLFPDTYFIDGSNFSPENLITQMLSNFDKKLTDQMKTDIAESGRTIRETVIVASMLEKEVRTELDIPIVAGIIWKRLDNDWTLGIDATLLYVQDDRELTAEDLAEESPYNTRLNTGLTPTAISNPGLASIMGAIYPEDSNYWFYLTSLDTGEVHYAETNAQHESNKARVL